MAKQKGSIEVTRWNCTKVRHIICFTVTRTVLNRFYDWGEEVLLAEKIKENYEKKGYNITSSHSFKLRKINISKLVGVELLVFNATTYYAFFTSFLEKTDGNLIKQWPIL
jgi:hypothetical protein